ncbi:hypothetical protein ACGFW5_11165 [Streptomyces sp. NPDC048416]|uniref:hypothetical protein n=1 Tax=Streptomyces sp. NPDC048416 TaxID=3365546 RepID=UPI003723C996
MSRPNRSRSSATARRASVSRARSDSHITDSVQAPQRETIRTHGPHNATATTSVTRRACGTPTAAKSPATGMPSRVNRSRNVPRGTTRQYAMPNGSMRYSTTSIRAWSDMPCVARSAAIRTSESAQSAPDRTRPRRGTSPRPR